MGDYGFTFGELSSDSGDDGYGGLFVKFRNNITINETNYVSGEKKPAILFDMRTAPIDWGEVTSPLLVNGNGLAVNKLTAPNVGLDIGTSDAIRVPVGTTTERPTGANGYIRYNSTTNDFEGYKESSWTSLTSGGGGSEVSLNTSSYDYLSISSGTITLGQIDISDDTNLVAGTGLTLSGDTLNVDAVQSGITSVGTLSSLNVSGTVGVDGITTFNEEVVFTHGTSSSSHIHYGGNKDWYIRSGETNGKVIIQDTGGNVGIGTSSPSTTLDVNGPIHIGPFESSTSDPARLQIEVDKDLGGYGGIEFRSQHPQGGDSTGATWVSKCGIYFKRGTNTTQNDYNSGYYGAGTLHFAIENVEDGTTDVNINDSIMTIHNDGYVGIGTTSPIFPLHITTGTNSYGNLPDQNQNYIRFDGSTVASFNFSDNNYDFSIYCSKSIFSEKYIAASDSRIKDNIEDIPDDTALQMVRDIPCRYYTYRDVVDRGSNRTIGFIAQEVKDVIPEAVDEISEYIPDEYRLLTASNKQWSYTNGEYHLKVTDLEITPNSSYRFIVGNNDGIDRETLEIEPNSDDTFTFSKTWSKIFLYGSRVNDFNVLDKQKIFAVHHAAIQELDRINTEQAQRIQILETQLADVVARLTALENA